MADAGGPIGAHHVVDLLARRRDAGEMGGGRELRFGDDPRHGCVGALARAAARAVGDRDETRRQRREPGDRLPQRRLHLGRLRREEFERDMHVVVAGPAQAQRCDSHHATSRAVRGSGSDIILGSRATQSETVSLSPASAAGARSRWLTIARPASVMKVSISSRLKPRRR